MTLRNQRFSILKLPISSILNQHLIAYPITKQSQSKRKKL
ncbi:unnamed protein product [Musa acuminata subsp. malaccensis]|uniref:Uncharacterized protein n=1 Tax=Musa acuminata subsp. malaccensis TaxID=214687 RepID=A0A804U5S4_MUSAM|nr:unnamed protein product [Musa acuminata subsp. malaccensis]